jgi:hypothetical protein
VIVGAGGTVGLGVLDGSRVQVGCGVDVGRGVLGATGVHVGTGVGVAGRGVAVGDGNAAMAAAAAAAAIFAKSPAAEDCNDRDAVGVAEGRPGVRVDAGCRLGSGFGVGAAVAVFAGVAVFLGRGTTSCSTWVLACAGEPAAEA